MQLSLQHTGTVQAYVDWEYANHFFVKAVPFIAEHAAEIKKKYGLPRDDKDTIKWKGYRGNLCEG